MILQRAIEVLSKLPPDAELKIKVPKQSAYGERLLPVAGFFIWDNDTVQIVAEEPPQDQS